MSSNALASFLSGLNTVASAPAGKDLEWWRYRNVLREFNDRCAYCSTELAATENQHNKNSWSIDYLVSRELGGTVQSSNLLAVCPSCRQAKGNRDWLSWRKAGCKETVSILDARRLAALEVAHNHLLRNPDLGKKKETVLRHLAARWSHPRFAVYAALTESDGFIAWAAALRPPRDVVALLVGAGGRKVSGDAWRLSPVRFHDVVWQLIDLNAWVRRINMGEAFPDPTPDVPGVSHWHLTYTNVRDIRRRRPKLKPRPIPIEERPMDWGHRLLIEYKASGEVGRPFDWGWVNMHRETDLAWERIRDAQRRQDQQILEALDTRMERERLDAEAQRQASLPLIDQYWLELGRRWSDPTSDAWMDFVRKHGAQKSPTID